jgi:hypothetical protein
MRVHADHIKVLDAVTLDADHAVQADLPHHLGENQHPHEPEHIRHRRADPSQRVAAKRPTSAATISGAT